MNTQKSEFSQEICGILDEFKRIYRSNKPNYQSANLSLEDFDISRKEIRTYSDKQLFQVIQKMIVKLNKILATPATRLYNHAGLREFVFELEKTLKSYKVDNINAIHVGRTAARIQVNVIQMLSQIIQKPSNTLENDMLQQIKKLNHLQHEETMKQLSVSFNSLRDHNLQLYSRIQDVIR
ncbi:MAG: hypothetical protein VX112_00345 [Pseudomonadota bacterium]|nr:hypothetical protein [Pseudomonadota bacterium]